MPSNVKSKLKAISSMRLMFKKQKDADDHVKKVRMLARHHHMTKKSLIEMSQEIPIQKQVTKEENRECYQSAKSTIQEMTTMIGIPHLETTIHLLRAIFHVEHSFPRVHHLEQHVTDDVGAHAEIDVGCPS